MINERIVELVKDLFEDDHLRNVARVFDQAPEAVDKQLRNTGLYTRRETFLLRLLILAKEKGFLDEALTAIEDERARAASRRKQTFPTVGREEEITSRHEAGESMAAIARDIGCSPSTIRSALGRHWRQKRQA